jgi:hypothetical protein
MGRLCSLASAGLLCLVFVSVFGCVCGEDPQPANDDRGRTFIEVVTDTGRVVVNGLASFVTRPFHVWASGHLYESWASTGNAVKDLATIPSRIKGHAVDWHAVHVGAKRTDEDRIAIMSTCRYTVIETAECLLTVIDVDPKDDQISIKEGNAAIERYANMWEKFILDSEVLIGICDTNDSHTLERFEIYEEHRMSSCEPGCELLTLVHNRLNCASISSQ